MDIILHFSLFILISCVIPCFFVLVFSFVILFLIPDIIPPILLSFFLSLVANCTSQSNSLGIILSILFQFFSFIHVRFRHVYYIILLYILPKVSIFICYSCPIPKYYSYFFLFPSFPLSLSSLHFPFPFPLVFEDFHWASVFLFVQKSF